MPVTVWAKAVLPGFHRWPSAPPHRDYLAARHRHEFHITAWAHVTHDDRDVEFHDLADAIRAWWGEGPRECGSASCERLARTLGAYLAGEGIYVTRVEVSEDGQAGAVCDILPAPAPEPPEEEARVRDR